MLEIEIGSYGVLGKYLDSTKKSLILNPKTMQCQCRINPWQGF